MGDDIDSFILEQKKKLNQERNKLDNSRNNGYKENIPPKGGQAEEGGGLLGGLGSYEDKRRRLQEERKKEYNQLLAEKKVRSTGRIEKAPEPAAPAPPEENAPKQTRRIPERHSAEGRRRPILSDDEDDAYRNRPPPRKGWATPTYEEILDKKRREERAYRRHDDLDSFTDRSGRFDEGSLRPAKSEGHINRYDDDDDFYSRDRDYEPSHTNYPVAKKSDMMKRLQPTYVDPDIEVSQYITQLKLRYGPEVIDEVAQNLRSKAEPGYGRRRVSSPPRRQPSPPPRRQPSPPTVTPQTRRQPASNTPRAINQPEPFSASLLVGPGGKETRVSADVRRKEEYRKELERQIEESKQNKRREKDEDRRLGPGAATVDVSNSRRPEPSPRKQNPPPAAAPAPVRQQPPVQPQPPPGPPPIRDYGNGYGLSRPSGILDNGWGNGLYGAAPPMMNPYQSPPPPGAYGSPGVGQPYMSPLDEAYYFYANRNPLDPNLGPGLGGVGGDLAGPRVQQQPPPPRNQPDMRIDTNTDVTSPRTQAQRQTNRNTARGGAGFGSAADEDRKTSRVEQQRLYQEELKRQMEEQKRKKQKIKEDEERYNRKIEEEIKNYDPFGKGGAGAPMRDDMGNIVANRKAGQAQGTNAESDRRKIKDITSPRTTPRGPIEEPVFSEPLAESFNNPDVGDQSGNFARGGNGIFGEPKTNQQKSQQQLYQEELRRQIEEKKRRQDEEKKIRDDEEKRMMQKIQEDQDKIKQEMEDEKRKEREKAEAAQKQQEELRRQQEERKKEEDRKRKEAEGQRLDELRRKQDEERRQRDQERARVQSPAIPTLRKKDSYVPPTSPPLPALQMNWDQPLFSEFEENRPESPIVPAARKQSIPSPPSRPESGKSSRVPSADVLKQLARMRQQLRSEKERVETDLTREKVKPSVYDPRLQHRNSKNDLDIFEVARNKEPVSVRRGRDSPYEQAMPGMDPKDLGIHRPPSAISANMLESESAFIDVPNGAASRSETPKTKGISRSSPKPGPDPMKVGSMVSVASLDPDTINARNEARLRKLKALSGDDISTGDPDDILEKFMASQKHKR